MDSQELFERWKPILRLVKEGREIVAEKARYERPWENPLLNLCYEVERAMRSGYTTDEAIFDFLGLASEGEWLNELESMLKDKQKEWIE